MAQFREGTAIDPFRLLGIKIDDEGKVTRSTRVPAVPPSESPTDDGVVSRDVTLDPSTGLSARIFIPVEDKKTTTLLPVVLYFHGGGFVIFKPSDIMYHAFCVGLARACGAIVVSVDYRRAPEHRLPAAYDDATLALRWLGGGAGGLGFEPDLTRVYVMGDSSGANIAYNVALRVHDNALDVAPVRVAGVVMVQPFFGGEQRMGSELRLERDRVLPLVTNDLLWSLALPEGSDRDHEFCNPLKRRAPSLSGFPATLVAVEGLDPMSDRQLEFVEWLRGNGVHVEVLNDPAGYHGAQLSDVAKAEALLHDVAQFISSCSPHLASL
uniref:Alpha/beta hydrolase fold-3 domain-containing protein n=1 Tax=Araucaria cunninghamii TaxID=56994 RepID=A0A0D6R4D5_ARACU